MRATPALVLMLGACGFQITSNAVTVDALEIVDDGGGLAEAWSFDTESELAVAGHARTGMVIEPRGSLTPDGYVYGGLLGRGETNTKLWTHGDTGWDKLSTLTATGAGVWAGITLTTTQDLGQFGIRRNAVMRTLWFEGEVLLSAGTEQLRIKGNDVAFLEIAPPGTSAFTPLLENTLAPTASVNVATTAWYPIRVGWADGDGSGDLELELLGAQGGYAPIAAHRLRAQVGSVPGVLRTVFYRQIYGGGAQGIRPPVQHISMAPFLASTQFAPPLQGSLVDTAGALTDASDWSARWAGQLYVATPGQYAVRVESDDGNRVFLGTAPVAETSWAHNGSTAFASTTATAALREGWNDLIVDYNQFGGTTRLAVQIVTSPDPALMGTLPSARLRPVEPGAERLVVRSIALTNPLPVPEDTAVFSSVAIPVAAQAGQIVTRVDMTVVFNSSEPDQLLFRVLRPGGTPVVVRTHPNITGGSRIVTQAASIDPALMGSPADGVWSIGVADDLDETFNSNTSIEEVHLTLHTSGGPEQIVRTATWQTPIKDLETRLVKVDSITWDERAPAGTAVELRVRSCAQADCSDEPSWGEPVAKGMPVARAQRRYLQAQVTMTSDGANEAELRSLQLMYRRAAAL